LFSQDWQKPCDGNSSSTSRHRGCIRVCSGEIEVEVPSENRSNPPFRMHSGGSHLGSSATGSCAFAEFESRPSAGFLPAKLAESGQQSEAAVTAIETISQSAEPPGAAGASESSKTSRSIRRAEPTFPRCAESRPARVCFSPAGPGPDSALLRPKSWLYQSGASATLRDRNVHSSWIPRLFPARSGAATRISSSTPSGICDRIF